MRDVNGGNGTPDEENEGRPGQPTHRIPLALVALVLYSGTVVHFLGTALSDRTAGGLIGALIRMVIEAGVTTALVMGVVLYRRRQERWGA
ncbi:hypothetical protein [Streptomyces sp. NPDC057280]|uniref:hypothetical protein n=1 Tax=Streptomyces sp. NPDC057280 TaxID=3346081 RepID=UPI0009A351DB|nr:hypothetical protein B1R27_26315 [Streptomyces sp. GKU 895]